MSKLEELRLHSDAVKASARGHWDRIYSQLAPELHEALAKPGKHVTCPIHGGRDDFRLPMASSKHPAYTEDGMSICTCGFRDGWQMLMALRGWDFKKAVDEVEAVLGGAIRQSNFTPVQVKRRLDTVEVSVEDDRLKAKLRRLWEATLPLTSPSAAPARLYLQKRRLGQVIMPMDDIGFHPGLDYYVQDKSSPNGYKVEGNYPALISIIRTAAGAVSTIHRTYLSADGNKAPVEGPRKLYGSPSTNPLVGGAIRIDRFTSPVLHVGEGLESSLAARAIVDNADPTWSTVNKELMRALVIPDYVQLLVIWADRDASWAGQTAAIELMDRVRASGRRAVVMLPPYELPAGMHTIDWNDVVANVGLPQTRNHFHVVRCLRGIAGFKAKLEGHVTEQGRASA